MKRAPTSAEAQPAPSLSQDEQPNSSSPEDQINQWQTPTPLPTKRTVPDLPTELIPEPLRLWLVDTAERACVHLCTIVIVAIVALSSLVGTRLVIRPKRHDDWLVVPNLWGAIVAPPGSLKSPILEAGTKPLQHLEIAARQAYEDIRLEVEVKRDRLQLEIESLKSQLKKPDNSKANINRTELEQRLLEKHQDLEQCQLIERRYIVLDATVEKLVMLLRDNPYGLLSVQDELSRLFASFDKKGRETDRPFYIEAWAGNKHFRDDRVSRETEPVRVTVSVIGNIQPAVIAKTVKQANDTGGYDGLLSRFQLLVYPDGHMPWINHDQYPNTEAKNRAFAIFEAIDKLTFPKSEDDELPTVQFSPEAQAVFDAWRDELERRLRSPEMQDRPAFAAHLAKYRSLMPSLALIFHVIDLADGSVSTVSESQEDCIGEHNARLAAAWCEFLELHAVKVYGGKLDPTMQAAHALLAKIEAKKLTDGVTVRELKRKEWSKLTTDAGVRQAIKVLEDYGHIRLEDKGNTQFIRLNPRYK